MNKKNMILRLFLKYFIIYLIIEIAILFIFGKADIVIKTSDNNYNVNCNFMIKSNGDEYFTEDKIKVNLMELELNYSILVNVDSDIDNMFGNNIFVIDDYIYYYKNNSDKLFRYNKKDNVIEEFNTSKFVNRTEVTTSIGIRTIERM